jgi:hypothetical protein
MSTSIQLLEFVQNSYGSHLPLELVWQAVLGATDQYLRGRLLEEEYKEACAFLHVRCCTIGFN